MNDIKDAIAMTAKCLLVIWALNQVNVTRNLVQKALTGY